MSFTWDASKATDNLKDHGVGFDEACTVFDDEYSIDIIGFKQGVTTGHTGDTGKVMGEEV